MLLVYAALLNVSKAGMLSTHLCQFRNKYYMGFNMYYFKVTGLKYMISLQVLLTLTCLCLSCIATEGCKFPKDSLVLLYKFSSTSKATPAVGVLVSSFFLSHCRGTEAVKQRLRVLAQCWSRALYAPLHGVAWRQGNHQEHRTTQ